MHKIKQDVAIFDLDGCLFDDQWRLFMIADARAQGLKGNEVYEKYHKNICRDDVLPRSIEVLDEHIKRGDKIVFFTARPAYEQVRKDTVDGIKSHLDLSIGYGEDEALLYMRDPSDTSEAPLCKHKMLIDLIKILDLSFEVVAAYDDRADVVAMYVENEIEARILSRDSEKEKPNAEQHEEQIIVSESVEEMLGTPYDVSGIKDFFSRPNAAEILTSAADTFRERNAQYKDNAIVQGRLMEALFPNGIVLKTAADHHFYHLFDLAMVKLTRFVNSGMRHQDSLRDLAVYVAMMEPIADAHNINIVNSTGNK